MPGLTKPLGKSDASENEHAGIDCDILKKCSFKLAEYLKPVRHIELQLHITSLVGIFSLIRIIIGTRTQVFYLPGTDAVGTS